MAGTTTQSNNKPVKFTGKLHAPRVKRLPKALSKARKQGLISDAQMRKLFVHD